MVTRGVVPVVSQLQKVLVRNSAKTEEQDSVTSKCAGRGGDEGSQQSRDEADSELVGSDVVRLGCCDRSGHLRHHRTGG